jgi:hypothetical protein
MSDLQVVTTESEFTPFEFKLGKAPAVRPALAMFHQYFEGTVLPVAPARCEYAMKVTYPMALNGTYGDCVVAGHVHLSQAVAYENGGMYAVPEDPAIKTEYFDLTGGADTGLVESAFLAAAQSSPILGSQIDVFAPVDHTNLDHIKSAIYLCGGLFLGVSLPQSAEQQFPGLWTVVTGSPIIGGHCIIAIGYDAQGVYLVSWGMVVKATWAWFESYVDEAYAVLYTEQVQQNRGPLKQLDIRRLRANVAAL